MFLVKFGVRQGSILSPFLFAVYVDELARQGLQLRGASIILYADDILLITRSVCQLEHTLRFCERELSNLDMAINYSNRVVYALVKGVMCLVLPSPQALELRLLGYRS